MDDKISRLHKSLHCLENQDFDISLSRSDNSIRFCKEEGCIHISFALEAEGKVTVTGQVGYADSPEQYKLILSKCQEAWEGNFPGGLSEVEAPHMRLFYKTVEEGPPFRGEVPNSKVTASRSMAVDEGDNLIRIADQAIKEMYQFILLSRSLFADGILETARTTELAGGKRRHFFGNLLCSGVSSVHPCAHDWFIMDYNDFLRTDMRYRFAKLIHVDGAEDTPRLMDNILSACNGNRVQGGCLIVRLVFPSDEPDGAEGLWDFYSRLREQIVDEESREPTLLIGRMGYSQEERESPYSATLFYLRNR